MAAPQILIATVGTSLLGNLKRDDAPPELTAAARAEHWRELGRLLVAGDPAARHAGAEINTHHELVQRGYLADPILERYYCHSATEDGRARSGGWCARRATRDTWRSTSRGATRLGSRWP